MSKNSPALYSDTKTNEALKELEKNISGMYQEAAAEMQKTTNDYFSKLQSRYYKEYAAYQRGEYTKDEFTAWYQTQVQRGDGYQAMTDKLASRATQADMVAQAYINDKTPSIYALNSNYEAYRIGQVHNIDFHLTDEQTVKELMAQRKHIEFKTVNINPVRSYYWNRKEIHKALTAGILQGKDIKELSQSYLRVMGRDKAAAIRNARTSFTSAQNAGREDAYIRAAEMGIELQKEWIATSDDRTRDTHGELDGTRVDYDDVFITSEGNELEYPADPNGAPEEVYNCRCTMRAILPNINDAQRETYSEWLARKEAEAEEQKRLDQPEEKPEQPDDKEEAQKALEGAELLGLPEVAEEATAEAAESDTLKYVYTEAATLKEAEEYATGVLGVNKVMYKGIDVPLANEINKSLTDALNYSDRVKEKIRVVGNAQTVNKAFRKDIEAAFIKDGLSPAQAKRVANQVVGRVASNTMAYARDEVKDRKWDLYPNAKDLYNSYSGICINSSYSTYDSMKRTVERSVSSGFHPQGSTEPRTVIDHELGHVLDFVYGVRDSEVIQDAYRDAKAMGIEETVSGYADKNIKEFIAECYSEYLNSDDPRYMANLVGREIERLRKENE